MARRPRTGGNHLLRHAAATDAAWLLEHFHTQAARERLEAIESGAVVVVSAGRLYRGLSRLGEHRLASHFRAGGGREPVYTLTADNRLVPIDKPRSTRQ